MHTEKDSRVDRRRLPRSSVLMSAVVDDAPGQIRDMNPWGVFFAAGMELERRVGDIVRIDLGDASLRARVCWTGWSLRHKRVGLGLEFVAIQK